MKYAWSAPEVMQTSSMDCGPACLKSLLQGMDISVNYGRLREVCQTNIDGTSIDTLEEIACEFGLAAQQVLVPLRHLSLPEAKATPAIIISQLPNSMTHFIVIWRSVGAWVQVMDPATGRHWITWEKLKQKIYLHRMSLAADTWLAWTTSDEYRLALQRRLVNLGYRVVDAQSVLDEVAQQQPNTGPEWLAVASFDAAITWSEALVAANAINKGSEAIRFLQAQYARAIVSSQPWVDVIPRQYWWVAPDATDDTMLQVEAAVLVRVTGKQEVNSAEDNGDEPAGHSPLFNDRLHQPEANPWSLLIKLLLPEQRKMLRWFVPLILFCGATVTLQALLFQGLLSMNNLLGTQAQFSAFIPMMFLFILLSALLEIPIAQGALALGRQVEMQFRINLFRKIPRIHDPYFRSRLLTDMASRSHKLYTLRIFPAYLVAILQQAALILFTLMGIWWLDTIAGLVASAMVVVLIIGTLFWQTLLSELEARAEVQSGVINLLYFDALKGLKTIRSQAAQGTIQTEQERQLNSWANTHYDHQRKHMGALLLLDLVALVCVAGLMLVKSVSVHDFVPNFLWLYWLLRLPHLVKQLGLLLLDLPPYQVALARYAELLGATETEQVNAAAHSDQSVSPAPSSTQTGVAITLRDVSLVCAGHVVLAEINLQLAAGQHIAVVGESGAGKSSLCELLLGWQLPSAGSVEVDGEPLQGEVLLQLRQHTAWVDANIQLWDRSLLDNINYDHGNGQVTGAGLGKVLANLPEGLQTSLSEGGRRLSGGEGQRVRIARALGVDNPRLVILDEPCRGLDRPAREQLLDKLRSTHASATLVCITHDISEALKFPYVVVMGQGSIVEQGSPQELIAQDDSALAQLQQNEQRVLQTLLGRQSWQPLNLVKGQLQLSLGESYQQTLVAKPAPDEVKHG
jgi:ABC-type bacteriocin/lantibiotic exporter with double-glycine peptidase domain